MERKYQYWLNTWQIACEAKMKYCFKTNNVSISYPWNKVEPNFFLN